MVLAVLTSAAVIFAGVTGRFTASVTVAAAAGACVIAALNVRQSRPLGELLPPLLDGAAGPVVIDAPRASQVAGPAGSHS
ncbi:MAG: hypothetical protein M3326_13915, partial [Actinomycetota bacterium]|nr:hypothetical protein [Actinomycetota bacterium]